MFNVCLCIYYFDRESAEPVKQITEVVVAAPEVAKVSNAKKNKQKKKNAKRKVQRALKQEEERSELKAQREKEREEKLIEKIKIPFEAIEKRKEKPQRPVRVINLFYLILIYK